MEKFNLKTIEDIHSGQDVMDLFLTPFSKYKHYKICK